MKKIMVMLLVLVVVVGLFTMVGYAEHNYTRKDCTVVRVEGNKVVFVDGCGYEWSAYADGLQVGDKADLHMYTDVTTSYVFDDKVVGIRVQK